MWKRVVAPVALVTLLWVIVSGATTWYISRLYEAHRRVLSDNVASIQAAGAMQDVLWRLQAVVMEAAGPPDEAARQEVSHLQAAFLEHLHEAEQTAFSPEEQQLVKAIGDHFTAYRDHLQRRLDTAPPVEKAPTAKQVVVEHVGRTMSLAQDVALPCKQLLELNEQLLADSTARNTQLVALFRPIRMVFLVAGPAIGILFGIWVARGLHRTVSQISVTLEGAVGELAHEVGRVHVVSSSDLPSLQHQAQVISSHIREVVDQLQAARREAIRTERLAAVGELAAGVAHELRNPLTSVKLLVQRAAQRRPDRSLNDKHLHVIQEEITRMENTIQGLLDFARPPELRRVSHDLRATMQRALNLIDGHAKQQDVCVTADLPDLPVVVDGDPEQLHQVLVNLLLNGIDAMSGGGVLEVAVEPCTDHEGMCRIRVCDSGSGIPASVMDRLFEPFVSSKQRGTGLGLAISRRIVQQHGGTLTAVNLEGRGAMFTIELPLATAVQLRIDAPAQDSPDIDASETSRKRRSVEVAGAKTVDH